MGDSVYIVNPRTGEPRQLAAGSFSEIGIRERVDLERWIIKHPQMLGEPLLIVTSEYARFDKSSRRLDVLALDKDGELVVVELKLDAAGSLADQQAIRYAAFCSTMTMEDVVRLYGEYHDVQQADAETTILDFLELEELPELSDRPRIILAAGSINDQELTACVLWLRRFGLDISCVELTPYRLPGADEVLLVPRTIIPLPETRAYQINVEKKEVAKAQDAKSREDNQPIWRAIADKFNALGLDFRASGLPRSGYMQVRPAARVVHYEWMLKKREGLLDIAIHFEDRNESVNEARAKPFEAIRSHIENGTGLTFHVEKFGKRWWQARFSIPFDERQSADDVATQAAELMRLLIERTRPMVDACLNGPEARRWATV